MNRVLISMVVLSLFATAVQAQVGANDEPLGTSTDVLATLGEVSLTQGEIDAALSKIPEETRLMFIRDGSKVEQMVRNLLRNKALANEAIKAGYDQDHMVQMRMGLGKEAALAQEWLTKVVADAPEVDYEALAEEAFLVDPGPWKTPDQIDVSHILISTENRSVQEAMDIAGYVWQQLDQDPLRFEALVEEFSEDPSKEQNGGRFPNVTRGELVPNFEKVAFAMQQPGQISGPTETDYGFHIIRLNKKIPGEVPPYEAIKEEAVEQAKEKYKNVYRSNYLRTTLGGDIVLQEGAADALARRYFGENLELAPDFSE